MNSSITSDCKWQCVLAKSSNVRTLIPHRSTVYFYIHKNTVSYYNSLNEDLQNHVQYFHLEGFSMSHGIRLFLIN